MRCFVCKRIDVETTMELAATAQGPQFVCKDGHACALRANGMAPALGVVHGPRVGGEAAGEGGEETPDGAA